MWLLILTLDDFALLINRCVYYAINHDFPPDFSQIYQIPGFFHGHVVLFQMCFYQCHLWWV